VSKRFLRKVYCQFFVSSKFQRCFITPSAARTASNIDTSRKLSSALPVFLIVVAILALALLTLAFRTILVPIKSLAGFLLSAFAAFMVGGSATIKAIGFSLAVGVLFDAFVVRLTLVPAVMSLVGGRIWYHPHWFDRRVPDLDIEGATLEPPSPHPATR
jgi:uncharacterized membrane protein YdfJ with MMPL/SSD domain